MPLRSRTARAGRRFARAAAIPILIASPACSSGRDVPVEPSIREITLSQIVDGSHPAAQTSSYALQLFSGQFFVVQLEVMSGEVTVSVFEEQNATRLATVTAVPDGQPLGAHSTSPVGFLREARIRIDVTGAGTFRIRAVYNPNAPERIEPRFAIGDTVQGEDLHNGSDVDEFTFQGEAGDELIAYLQGVDQAAGRFLMFVGRARNGGEDTLTTGLGRTGTRIDASHTGRFILPTAGEYRVRLQPFIDSFDPARYTGRYRFMLRRIVRPPESVPQTFTIGDTTFTERLDYVGDIDEFILTGPPGSQATVFFQVTERDKPNMIEAAVVDVPSPDALVVESRAVDTLLTDRTVGRFTLPASGRGTLRIWMPDDGLVVGAYTLRIVRIDPQPESRPAALVLSDSALQERIELPGDVDEFTLSLPTADTISFAVDVDPDSWWIANERPTVSATLTRMGDASGAGGNRAHGLVISAELLELEPGNYQFRIAGSGDRVQGFFGGYEMRMYRVRSVAEGHSGIVAIGETVTSTLDPLGDRDVFRFTGAQGDHIEVEAHGIGTPTPDFCLGVSRGTTAFGSTCSLDDTRTTGRITLPESGEYTIRVGGTNFGTRGPRPYSFTIKRLTAAPETHGASLVVGETVSDERIDYDGDVDEFVLRGAPGTEIALFIEAGEGAGGVTVEALDRITKDVVRSTTSFVTRESTGRLVLPASGELLVRVSGGVRPYRLDIVAINRAPETVPATVALGDTVGGEAVDPDGDVDEYRFTGSAGQRVVAFLHTPTAPSTAEGLVLEVLASGGSVLGKARSVTITPFEENTTGTLTLPVTGEYRIRVRGFNDRSGRGAYRFLIRLEPPA